MEEQRRITCEKASEVDISKEICTNQRENLGRSSKDKAIKALNTNVHSEEEENDENNVDIVKRNVSITNINMGKQFEKFAEHCDRKELFRVHDPKENSGDSGSEGVVYVEFQAGVFEALRNNMMRILNHEYQASFTQDPHIDLVGKGSTEVESRVLLDMKITLNEVSHMVKIKIYNTKCTMDFQATKENPNLVHEHLGNETVGRHIASKVIPKVIEKLSSEPGIDFQQINKKWRKLATEGAEKVKDACLKCKKPKSNKKAIKCGSCNGIVHTDCEKSIASKDLGKYKDNQLVYRCKECVLNFASSLSSEFKCDKCDFKSNAINTLDVHKKTHIEDSEISPQRKDIEHGNSSSKESNESLVKEISILKYENSKLKSEVRNVNENLKVAVQQEKESLGRITKLEEEKKSGMQRIKELEETVNEYTKTDKDKKLNT